jgi:4-hydroxy-3-methylbut-2-enyl diphosphate reductase
MEGPDELVDDWEARAEIIARTKGHGNQAKVPVKLVSTWGLQYQAVLSEETDQLETGCSFWGTLGYDKVLGKYCSKVKMATENNGKVLLRVRPRGFCAGVVRAVDIVELALEAYGAPVYVHHEIVHNTYVVEQLRRRGAIFVESIDAVPHGAVLVFSAHGVPPTVRQEAKDRSLKVIDATCPLVTKVHLEALKFAREKRTIILIGHRDHQEIVGTSGEAPDRTIVVDSVAAVDALEVEEPDKLSFLTQTTLSLYDTQEIVARLRQKFPAIKGPASDDICYATQNRQEAVEQVAKDVDFILVVGSPNSSNSNRLVEVAKRSGVPAQLIDSAGDIDVQWLAGVERVGLTAGASAPEVLVEQVSQRLAEFGFTDQRDLDLIREDVRFTLPPELATIAAAPRR